MTTIIQMLLVLQQATFQTLIALVASIALLFFIYYGTSNHNQKCVGKLPLKIGTMKFNLLTNFDENYMDVFTLPNLRRNHHAPFHCLLHWN